MTKKTFLWIFIIVVLIILSITCVVLMKIDSNKSEQFNIDTSKFSEDSQNIDDIEVSNEDLKSLYDIYTDLLEYYPRSFYSESHAMIRVPVFDEDLLCFIYIMYDKKKTYIEVKLVPDVNNTGLLCTIQDASDVAYEISSFLSGDGFYYLKSNLLFHRYSDEELFMDW